MAYIKEQEKKLRFSIIKIKIQKLVYLQNIKQLLNDHYFVILLNLQCNIRSFK